MSFQGMESGSDSDDGEVFLKEEDIVQEIDIDEDDLPDCDDEDEEILEETTIDSDVDFESDDAKYVFSRHSAELYTVACCPTNASLVATGGMNNNGFVWLIGPADNSRKLQDHIDTISTLSFSYDGKLLATGGFDGLILVWDTSSINLQCKFEDSIGGFEWLKWHPRQHLLIAGSDDHNLYMWDADSNALLNTFSGHGSSVTCGDFTPDGNHICTGSDDASLRIWDPRSGKTIHVVRGYPYHTEGLTCLSITSDSTVVITGSTDGSVHMVNIATGKVNMEKPITWKAKEHACDPHSFSGHSNSVECIGLATSYRWAATGGNDQKLIIWDLQSSSERCTCDHKEKISCLLWLGASQYVATGCLDGKVRIWDSLTGNCTKIFSGHADTIQSLAATADGKFLVSASDDGTARVFAIQD